MKKTRLKFYEPEHFDPTSDATDKFSFHYSTNWVLFVEP